MTRRALPWSLLLAACLLAGCRSPLTVEEVADLMDSASLAIRHHEAVDEFAEAAMMARVVSAVDPGYPGIAEAIERSPADLYDRGYAGSNIALREPIDASTWRRVLLYLPDRVKDFFDIWSLDVHVGLGLYSEVHITRAFTLGGGARSVVGIGGHYQDTPGIQGQQQLMALASVGFEGLAGSRIGLTGVNAGAWAETGFPSPLDPLYQDFRDYWAWGAAVTVLFAGVDADIHLYQLYDFLAGFALFDPCRDDWATTRALSLTLDDRQLLQELGQVALDQKLVRRYRASLAGQDARAHDGTAVPDG